MLLVTAMTYILGLESLAVHLPATFSQFEQQSIIWYSFLCQVMCCFTYKHMYVWKAQQQT